MIRCPLCATCFTSVSIFLSHLRLIHASEAGFQIPCGLQGCQRTFSNFYTYRNHVYSMHDLNSLDTTTNGSCNDLTNTESAESTGQGNTTPDIEMSCDAEESCESSEIVSLLDGKIVL